MKTTVEILKSLDAYNACERVDWLIFILRQAFPVDARFRLAACDIAESVLHLSHSDRPRVAIETARRFSAGNATVDELREARKNASCAAAATGALPGDGSSMACATTDIAASCAAAACSDDSVASTSYDTATRAITVASTSDTAHLAQQKTNCNILRKHFPFEEVMRKIQEKL